MALFADTTECSTVNIICAVTPDTTRHEVDFIFYGYLMARVTVQAFMCTVEVKSRPFVMIKIPCTPIAWIVTLLASRAETALVYIIFVMTGDALDVRILEGWLAMTVFTR